MNFEVLGDAFKVEAPVSIVVIGTGGGGCNAINGMIERGIKGVKFVAVNTDVQALNNNRAEIKLQIGSQVTGGMGAGGMPEVGEKAALEDKEQIAKVLDGADMVFLTAGMGGGTGTGSAPIIAHISKSLGALTVAVVTKPFDFELPYRMDLAEKGIAKLRQEVDSLIVIPNQKLLDNVDRRTSIPEAFRKADDILYQGVEGISASIVQPGLINIDFADAMAVMKDQGDARMAIGYGSGDNRVEEAVSSVLDNPLLEDISIKGSTRALIYVAGGEDLPIMEFQDVVKRITADMDRGAIIKTGIFLDPSMKDQIRVTVFATGFYREGASEAQAAIESHQSGEVISHGEFNKISGNMLIDPGFLPRREKRDMHIYDSGDLDVPTVIRDRRFFSFTGEEQLARVHSN